MRGGTCPSAAMADASASNETAFTREPPFGLKIAGIGKGKYIITVAAALIFVIPLKRIVNQVA